MECTDFVNSPSCGGESVALLATVGAPRQGVSLRCAAAGMETLRGDEERLYRSYSVKQKRAALQCFLCAAILYDVYWLVVRGGQDVLTGGLLLLAGALLLWVRSGQRVLWDLVPHLAWHLATVQLLVHLFFQKHEVTLRTNLGWALLVDYLIYLTLPLRLRYCLILSLGTCGTYLATIVGLARQSDSHLTNQPPRPLPGSRARETTLSKAAKQGLLGAAPYWLLLSTGELLISPAAAIPSTG
ncbi:hypothetical protein LSTR_LSTR017162 [Laodelphax striatellus]|uniref:Adenylate cyclase N-terminal domain-containing protein n=1 Tax=Laodelphax striatellus TaxID=195883 RepID=A0A482WNP1_LAOST|nr:hypothetical protein LSTR_LSTR017162 [Laodelphax striatellus]